MQYPGNLWEATEVYHPLFCRLFLLTNHLSVKLDQELHNSYLRNFKVYSAEIVLSSDSSFESTSTLSNQAPEALKERKIL